MGKKVDLTKKRFGQLVVLEEDSSPPHRKQGVWWVCRCDCGGCKSVRSWSLRSGAVSSCGRLLTEVNDLVGQRFGKLVVIEEALRGRNARTRWVCKCDCGTERVISGSSLTRKKGNTTSCGCYRRDQQGPNGPTWNGGKYRLRGYVMLLAPNHPNAMKSGYIREHILVMSEMLGRPLRSGERVHHKNGIRDDNRPENLELWTTKHPYGQRVSDVVEFCIGYLKEYAPGVLK